MLFVSSPGRFGVSKMGERVSMSWRSESGDESWDFENLLRAHRPAPSPEFVDALMGRLSRSSSRPRLAASRIAFAGALSSLMIGTFASFGGFAYAAAKAENGLKTVANVASADRVVHVSGSPAADQYGSGGTPPAGGVSGAGGGSPLPQASPSGELPFTGFPLMLSGAIGFALFAFGVALHGREARR